MNILLGMLQNSRGIHAVPLIRLVYVWESKRAYPSRDHESQKDVEKRWILNCNGNPKCVLL